MKYHLPSKINDKTIRLLRNLLYAILTIEIIHLVWDMMREVLGVL